MQTLRYDGADERLAVAVLCLNSEVLARVSGILPQNPFPSKWSNVIVNWCISHQKQFGDAPGSAGITALFADWSRSADKDTAALVERFLENLEIPQINSDYAVALIQKLVARTAAKQLADRVNSALSQGRLEDATDAISGFKQPEFASRVDYIEPLADEQVLLKAYEDTAYASLIAFPPDTAFGRWFGPTLHRDALVAFAGADKSGKSSHLASLCQRAVMQGLRVAFFNLGDLSQSQALKRWTTAFVGRPAFPCTYRKITSLQYGEDKEPVCEYDGFSDSGYTESDAVKAWKKVAERGSPDRLRFISRPADSFTAEEIRNKLRAWADAGWVPDVIGIDYADLLGKNKQYQDSHESIGHNWKILRAIGTEFQSLVLTATQVKAEGYGTFWLGREHFSGSKAKNAHVNAMIGINITENERSQQVCRFNWIVLREAEYLLQLPSRYIAVGGSPSIGRFHQISCFV